MRRLTAFIALALVLSTPAAYGAMYGITNTTSRYLYDIDPTTGAVSNQRQVNSTNGNFNYATSLAFAPDGQLYLYDATTKRLGVLDPDTALVTMLPWTLSYAQSCPPLALRA